MDARVWLVCGSLLACLAVAAGAFGAHVLEARLKPSPDASQNDRDLLARRMHNFDVATRYQMYHALALVSVGLLSLQARSGWLDVAGCLFIAGITLFSGMLYAWVFWQARPLVMLVPVGGAAFIVGWLALAVAATSVKWQEAPVSTRLPSART